jgi:hypothetical protein
MKTGIKIIQYKDGMYGAKKRGWFGLWFYLNEIYDGNWGWHYSWCPWPPDGYGCYDRFATKKAIVTALSDYYHSRRALAESSSQ